MVQPLSLLLRAGPGTCRADTRPTSWMPRQTNGSGTAGVGPKLTCVVRLEGSAPQDVDPKRSANGRPEISAAGAPRCDAEESEFEGPEPVGGTRSGASKSASCKIQNRRRSSSSKSQTNDLNSGLRAAPGRAPDRPAVEMLRADHAAKSALGPITGHTSALMCTLMFAIDVYGTATPHGTAAVDEIAAAHGRPTAHDIAAAHGLAGAHGIPRSL